VDLWVRERAVLVPAAEDVGAARFAVDDEHHSLARPAVHVDQQAVGLAVSEEGVEESADVEDKWREVEMV
jgi:hypothetical protein